MSLECRHNRIVVRLAGKVAKSSDSLLELVYGHGQRGVEAFLFMAAEDAAEKLALAVNFGDVIEQQNHEVNILDLKLPSLKTVIKIG